VGRPSSGEQAAACDVCWRVLRSTRLVMQSAWSPDAHGKDAHAVIMIVMLISMVAVAAVAVECECM
jgi:hypothetical protein